jgi:release factor glutamine methyltransferase
VGVGVDVSEAACLQTSANAVLHHVHKRSDIKQSDWFDQVSGQFDLIVSNPPYLSKQEMEGAQPELVQHEPRIALTDEKDGLSVYRLIAKQASAFLAKDGRILVEIGAEQGHDVRAIFEQSGWQNIRLLPDLDGRDRVIHADLSR